jgi:hypothetical protein
MMEVGDRVTLNMTLLDAANLPAREGAAGMVVGHQGNKPIVSLDADPGRVVVWEARAFRPIRKKGTK